MSVPQLDSYCTVKTNADLATQIGLGRGEPHSAPHTGTKALMLAVLEDGIQTYLREDLRPREEAERWVVSRRHGSAFSFVVLCETLGFEPSAVRKALGRLRATKALPKTIGRSRPNVCHRTLARLFVPKRRRVS